MTATKYSDSGISPRTNVYAAREMLKHAGPVIVLDKFGMTKPMPKNKTQTIKFRRPKVFTAKDVPLTEGVTPTTDQFSYEDVSTTLKQYGQLVEVTDHIEDTHEDPVLNDASQQCGENIGRTMEALTFGTVKAGTNVAYANGSARASVNTPVALGDIRKAVRFLQAQKGMRFTKVMDGSPNYGTRPIEASWVAAGHTDLENDIREMPGFVPCAEYGSRNMLCPQELGSVENVRFVLSPDLGPWEDGGGTYNGSGTDMVSTSGASADVYPLLVFAKESYGCVPLRGQGAVEPTIIPVGKKDKSDPLGQRGYVGWKTWFACVRLNEAWMYRLEVAATAL